MREFPFPASGLVATADDNDARGEQSLDACRGRKRPPDSCFIRHAIDQGGRNKMKLRIVAPLVLAASAAAIGLAPIAAADATVNQTPGNVQVTATPGTASQTAA